jgi:hypothetical protein
LRKFEEGELRKFEEFVEEKIVVEEHDKCEAGNNQA